MYKEFFEYGKSGGECVCQLAFLRTISSLKFHHSRLNWLYGTLIQTLTIKKHNLMSYYKYSWWVSIHIKILKTELEFASNGGHTKIVYPSSDFQFSGKQHLDMFDHSLICVYLFVLGCFANLHEVYLPPDYKKTGKGALL